ncbi:MAG TPA: pyrroline-5-carboxylate reductase [Clostridia bacterium]|nr:pyrroline-5-carboxylate reductase [Clostridia bacterium]
MGEALVAGALRSGQYRPEEIIVSEPLAGRRSYLEERWRVCTSAGNMEAVQGTGIIVTAVKPQVFFDVLKPLTAVISPEQLLISVAAGITTGQIESMLTGPVPVIRVMPNTPCLVGKGAAVLARGTYALEEHVETAKNLFGALGFTAELPEGSLDGVTALSGSGPAYVFLMLEALIEGGVRVGLPRELSRELVLHTVAGAVDMLVETGQHPAVLKEMVTSPGGTTACALEHLETEGLRGTLIKAVVRAWERARELSGAKE